MVEKVFLFNAAPGLQMRLWAGGCRKTLAFLGEAQSARDEP
jgi:hypothetical protein